MSQYCIKIADTVCEINTVHVRPRAISRDFIVDEAPDCSVTTTPEDLQNDRLHFSAESRDNLWEGIIEVYTVLRKVADRLIDFDILLMHGAVVAVDGKAYMFTGKSGIGKTTHIRQWLARCPGAYVVNGDKPFLKIREAGELPLACGSPWAGKENIFTTTVVPLQAIVMLERSEYNEMKRVSFSDSFLDIFQQMYRPEDEEKMRKTIQLVQRMNPGVSFWRFKCNNFKEDCFDVAFNTLVRNQK